MPETRSTTIRFSEEVYRRLEAAGVLTGLPINSIVVVACLEWLERHGPERLTAPRPEHAFFERIQSVRPGGRRVQPPTGWLPGRRSMRGPQPFDLLSDLAREAMDLAHQNARQHQHGSSYVGTEHLLLGILIEGEGVAAHALSDTGATVDKVREELARLLVDEGESEGKAPDV